MEQGNNNPLGQSLAAQHLGEFIQGRGEKWAKVSSSARMNDLEDFEQKLHELIMALECELMGEELSRYDVTAEEIEVQGQVYQRGAKLSETYLTAAGRVSVERHLYYGVKATDSVICPLEWGCGIIGGYFTPRAARQAAFVVAHLTPGESEALLAEIGNMRPSRSSLDRLTKTLSTEWENQRVGWERQLCLSETVPAAAQVIALSVDGVMAPLRGANQPEKAAKPGKHASGPTGYKEVGCGTVTLYDQETQRLQTIRYARMPEPKKVTLQQQLETETATILAGRPDLRRVHLADGAKDNWRLLDEIETHLPTSPQAPIEIVDFYHACDHLKQGCDAAWGESTPQSQLYFERLKSWLKEADNGTQRVIRTLRFQHALASGNKRRRLEAELTYFRNQQPRMYYAQYLRQNLPIASGVMEASCKTLVTQRLKRSGMVWTPAGGQAILTLRSLIQSNRWSAAWNLLRTNFYKPVKVPNQPYRQALNLNHTDPLTLPTPTSPCEPTPYAALPLAA